MPDDRKPLARASRRDVPITFKTTEEEARELHDDAATEDVPLSWLIRRRLRMGKSMEQAAGIGKRMVG